MRGSAWFIGLTALLVACGDDSAGVGGAGGAGATSGPTTSSGTTTTTATASSVGSTTTGAGGDPSGTGGATTGSGGEGGETSAGGGGAAAHETVTADIGPEGGTLAHPLGAVVTIPAGALEDVVTIAITDRDEPAGAVQLGDVVGTAFTLEPHGQTFLLPATLELPFDPGALSGGAGASDLRVVTAPGGTEEFAVLPTTPAGSEAIVASTLHFSEVVSIDPNGDPFEILTTSPLPDGEVDAGYLAPVEVSGGTTPQLWGIAAGALPPGLALVADGDGDGATIEGTPTAAGSFAFSVRVVDFDGLIAERDFTLAVDDGGGGSEVLASGLSTPAGIAVDATHVYWTELTEGTVSRTPLGGGAPEVLASGQQGPLAIAVDTTHVYWTNYQGGSVARLPLAGGSPVTIASGVGQPRSIAIDASDAFFADELGTIRRVAKAGGAVTTLANGQTSPWSVVIDDVAVYWTTNQVGGFVRSVAKDGSSGGVPAQLAFGQSRPAGLAIDRNQVYWTNEGDGTIRKSAILSDETGGVIVSGGAVSPRAVAVDPTGVYWGDGGALEAASFGDGAATAVDAAGTNVSAIVTDATRVYWADYGAGTIRAAPLPFDGPAIEVVVDDAVLASPPVADATHVYYAEGDQIRRAPLAGGPPEVIATGQADTWSVALDAGRVYWATFFEGALRRAPKGGGAIEDLASGLDGALGLVVASDRIFVNPSAEIVEVPIDGGAPTLVAATQGSGCAFAADASDVYWANPYDGMIRKRAISGGPITTLTTISPAPNAVDIAIDGSHLFWVDFTGGNVRRIPLGGGAIETLQTGQGALRGLGLDANDVYWSGAGAVRKSPKAGGPVESVVALRRPDTLLVVDEQVVWADWEAILAAPSGGTAIPPDPPPVLAALSRDEVRAGSGDLLLFVQGSGFLPGAEVLLDDAPLPTTFLSSTSVRAIVPEAALAALGTLVVTAENPPGGTPSNELLLDVVGGGNGIPTLISAAPSSVQVPSPGNDVAVTLSGSGFVAPVEVWLGPQWIEAPVVIDPATVSIVIPWNFLQSVGTVGIVVHNPMPGGGASQPVAFEVTP